MAGNNASNTPTLLPNGNAPVRFASLALAPRASDSQCLEAVLPTDALSFIAQPLPNLLPSGLAAAPPVAAWKKYRIRLLSGAGNPIKNERCILYLPAGPITAKTNDKGVAEFAIPEDLLGSTAGPAAARPALVVLPDILEDFDRPGEQETEFVDVPQLQELKQEIDPSFRYRKGDRMSRTVITLSSGNMDVTVDTLTEQQKFEHFRWSYVSNDARYAGANPGDYITANARWEWGRGSVCNQHVNFFLGYWFNYTAPAVGSGSKVASFTAAGSGTDMAYLTMLDSGTDKFTYKGGTKTHRGYRELIEPVTEFSGGTHRPEYSGEEFPGRAKIGTPKLAADGSVVKNRFVRPEEYVKYLRLGQFIDWSTRKLNARGQQLVLALGDFNVYSVSEFTDPSMRTTGLAQARAWLKKNKALDRLQVYGAMKNKTKVPLAQLSDNEIGQLPDALIWEIVWKLDDEQPEESSLLADMRTGFNTDHHAGIIVKRAVGGGPLTRAPGEQVELYKFSADSTGDKKIVMKKFVESVSGPNDPPWFTHYGIWKLKPLRAGGYAPDDEVTRASVGKIDLDALSRFIYWR